MIRATRRLQKRHRYNRSLARLNPNCRSFRINWLYPRGAAWFKVPLHSGLNPISDGKNVKYKGQPDFQHGTPEKMGVLIVNLGTPDAPETPQVRRYLAQFLSDPRIIEMARWKWNIILHGIILRIRPKKSAEAYRQVWSDTDGSPLLSHSKSQASAIQRELTSRMGNDVVVALGMRYGNPSVEEALGQLEQQNVRRLIVLPMYPQYSGTTTASVFDEVTNQLQRTRWLPEVRFINQYIDEGKYISALANSVRRSWEEHGRGDMLVTSYHGIPRRYLLDGDPYHCQCHKTTRLLIDELEIDPDSVKLVFQSRVGREEWLRPYCDETMKALPGQGVKSIDVICPGFAADCLETIEEIDEENKEYFMENGGERYQYIPCLNDDPEHIQCLAALIQRHAQGWPETDPYRDHAAVREEYAETARRATELTQREKSGLSPKSVPPSA